jgi:hypothetical protein
MKVRVLARSISRPVRERLWPRPESVEGPRPEPACPEPFDYAQDRRSRRVEGRCPEPVEGRRPFVARVLAVFEHACDLVTSDGGVVALVTPQIGNGPLNIVVEGGPEDFTVIEPGMPAGLGGRAQHAVPLLRVGGLEVVLEGATVWEPRPDWSALRAQRAVIEDYLPLLRAIALRHTPAVGRDGILSYAAAREAAEALQAGWQGDLARLQEGAIGLAGLGGGLTPAGDDFLTGAMLWAWLAHPIPLAFCHTLVEAAAPRTTTLSAAFLRAAAQGECNAAWHRLLAALRVGAENELAAAVREVLAYGATSGADALAGFLWLGSQVQNRP